MDELVKKKAGLAKAYDGFLLTVLRDCEGEAVEHLLAADPSDHLALANAKAHIEAARSLREEFERCAHIIAQQSASHSQ